MDVVFIIIAPIMPPIIQAGTKKFWKNVTFARNSTPTSSITAKKAKLANTDISKKAPIGPPASYLSDTVSAVRTVSIKTSTNAKPIQQKPNILSTETASLQNTTPTKTVMIGDKYPVNPIVSIVER